jgi:GTP-binding protein HflX
LTREQRFTSPNLFTTLDPVLRRVSYQDGLHFFLSDTVGFIKKLPVELVTSFQATLEEVREADAICHIIDVTSPHSREQELAVEKVLAEIGVIDVPVLKIFNKIDLLPEAGREDLLRRNGAPEGRAIYVSALTGEGAPELMEKLREVLFREYKLFYLLIPRGREEMTRSLSQRSIILKKRERDDGVNFKIMADPAVIVSYLPFLEKGEDRW